MHCIYIYTHNYIKVKICLYTCIKVYIYIYIYVDEYMYIHLYIRIHVYIYVYAYHEQDLNVEKGPIHDHKARLSARRKPFLDCRERTFDTTQHCEVKQLAVSLFEFVDVARVQQNMFSRVEGVAA